MKAREWVSRYTGEDKQEEFILAYMKETAELIVLRTKGSGIFTQDKKSIDTRPVVTDGALREQCQKWAAICRQLPSLTPEMFDQALEKYLPEVTQAQRKWQESLKKKDGAEEKGKAGRKLAESLG